MNLTLAYKPPAKPHPKKEKFSPGLYEKAQLFMIVICWNNRWVILIFKVLTHEHIDPRWGEGWIWDEKKACGRVCPTYLQPKTWASRRVGKRYDLVLCCWCILTVIPCSWRVIQAKVTWLERVTWQRCWYSCQEC